MGPRTIVGILEKTEIFCPWWESNLGLSSLHPSHCTDYSSLLNILCNFSYFKTMLIPHYMNFSCFSAIAYFNPLVLELNAHSDVHKTEI
jgi:hypothetical protein